ncbi:pirin family protein [uncultured Hymenobacter sp.]|uniref:pirin family protein n=1 Tax=uncultured Hymenobacter sp. TaxID=170016 RepID=UPI0035CC0E5B
MAPPRYQDITSEHVVVRREAGVTYRVYSGNSGSAVSSTKNYAPVTMVEIQVEAGHSASQDLPADYTGFLYVLEGAGVFGSNQVAAGKGKVVLLAALPDKAGASELTFTATERLRVVFYAGRPLQEPVVARGPFVMNTEDEIKQAYADYRAGKF